MAPFETRIRLLRGTYLAVVMGGAGYLVTIQQPIAATVVGAVGLLKAAPWVRTWLIARRALAGPWPRATFGALDVGVPPGWTVEPTNEGRGVQLDGPGALVQLIVWPHRETSAAAAVQAMLDGMTTKVRLRGVRPCEGTVAGFAAAGQRGDIASASDAAVVQVLAARTADGRLLTVSTYRDVGVPAALTQRCADEAVVL